MTSSGDGSSTIGTGQAGVVARQQVPAPADPLRGRFAGAIHPALDAANRSLPVDIRLWREDLTASRAHARMLGATGILPDEVAARLLAGLDEVEAEFAAGRFVPQPCDEDIHMAVERRLVELIGEDGKRLHTARSRNDQVATDLLLHLRSVSGLVQERVREVQRALLRLAERDGDALLPFYTHLQRAQPVLLGHVLLAWVELLENDRRALELHGLSCPLGSAAGAGTGFPVDREMVARELLFDGPSPNALAATASRQEATRFAAGLAGCAITLSRLGADLVLWTSREFGFARLGDAVTTGSSIMPNKRNPDGAELLRAKACRVTGALQRLLELQRGLPLGYSKDLQEDKPALFEAEDTLQEMLALASAMLADIGFDRVAMRAAVDDPASHVLATEVADWLVRRGVAFREAHEAVGRLVRRADELGVGLAALPEEELLAAHPALDAGVREALTPAAAVASRRAPGGTALEVVGASLRRWRQRLPPR